jgi:hypothetical protein
MSISAIVLFCNAGVSRISLHRLRVKTTLPAPMKVIFGIAWAYPFQLWGAADVGLNAACYTA